MRVIWDNVTIELDNLLTDATVASASLQGTGTKDDPYLINNPADFKRYMNDWQVRPPQHRHPDNHRQLDADGRFLWRYLRWRRAYH